MFQHLEEEKMTYGHHFCRSFHFSLKFFVASFKACIHSIYPDIFITSTTDTIQELSKVL